MSSMDNTDKATPNARTGRGAAENSDPTVNVSRRNIVKASLASGPVIMTVVSRPAGAVSGGSMHSPHDAVGGQGGGNKDKDNNKNK